MLCIIGQVRASYKYFFTNVPESSSITTEDNYIILKAYSTQKVGSGGNFESGNQVYGRQEQHGYVYLY